MEDMEQKKKINKNIVFSVIAVILLVVVVLGGTVAYFSAQANTDVQTVTTANLSLGFTNGDIIRATDITPIADADIETKATELPFSVTNEGGQHMNLTISLTDITISDELKDVDFRWGLYNADTGNGLSFGIFSDLGDATSTVIYRDTIIDAADPDITNNYILRVWVHDDGALQNYMQGKSFSAKVTVDGDAVEYTDESCFTFNEDYGAITDYDASCGTDVVIPKTINNIAVKKIGYSEDDLIELGLDDYPNTFKNYSLSSIIISNSVTEIGYGSFYNNHISSVTLPENITFIDGDAFANNQIERIYLSDDIYLMGAVFKNNMLTSIVFPGKIFFDSDSAVANNLLSNVILMEGITMPPLYGFRNNQLTSVELPASINEVASGTFESNTNLTEIIVRGKTSLDDFKYEVLGLTELTGVNIVFRP